MEILDRNEGMNRRRCDTLNKCSFVGVVFVLLLGGASRFCSAEHEIKK